MVDALLAACRFGVLCLYLDGRQRGLLLAVEAIELGRGGLSALAEGTGAARSTIRAGLAELGGEAAESVSGRGCSCRPGGR